MKSNFTTNIKKNPLIAKRDNLTNEITRNWKIIKTENVVKKGFTRNYEIDALFNYTLSLYDQLTIVKLRIQCKNMGIRIKDLPADANIINIYKLSALNEYYVKLGELMQYPYTIDPVLKAKKGKKGLSVTEKLTRNFLREKQIACNLRLNELRKKIADFNDNMEEEDEVPLFLTA